MPLFLQFFSRNLVKTRRTAERPPIPITFREIYFLTKFHIFYKGSIFAKSGQKLKFLDLNANRLEI